MSIAVLFFYGFAFLGIVYSSVFSVAAIRNKEWDTCIMLLFLFIQSLIIVQYVFYWSGLYIQYPFFNNISLPILLLLGPLLYMYIDLVCAENRQFRYYYWHFIPSIGVLIFLIPFYLNSFGIQLFEFRTYKYLLKISYIPYFIMVIMMIYVVVNFTILFKKHLVGHIKGWLILLNTLFGLYVLSHIFYYLASRQPWYTFETDQFVSLSSCASIVAIIYFSYGKKHIFNGLTLKESIQRNSTYLSERRAFENTTIAETNSDETQFVKYKNSGLTDNARNEVAQALSDLMQREKLYRESELKLETLAQKLGVERHYVSQVINQNFGVNFFEYINLLRIEEAKNLLLSSDTNILNIIEVAYQVGYNTKNTFNTAFRRIVGVTPSEFRKKQR